MLGDSLEKVHRIDETPLLPELLEAIDRADMLYEKLSDQADISIPHPRVISWDDAAYPPRPRELRLNILHWFVWWPGQLVVQIASAVLLWSDFYRDQAASSVIFTDETWLNQNSNCGHIK